LLLAGAHLLRLVLAALWAVYLFVVAALFA